MAFLPEREADDVCVEDVVGVVTDAVGESRSLEVCEERFGELEARGS